MFEARARIGAGPWGAPARLPFTILPAWWETWPVRILGGLLALALVFGVVKLRVRTLERNQARLEAVVAERTEELENVNESLRIANELFEHLSVSDALTGVANRRAFDRQLDLEWRRSLREQRPIALLLLDVDSFKGYNDTYGHPGRRRHSAPSGRRAAERGPAAGRLSPPAMAARSSRSSCRARRSRGRGPSPKPSGGRWSAWRFDHTSFDRRGRRHRQRRRGLGPAAARGAIAAPWSPPPTMPSTAPRRPAAIGSSRPRKAAPLGCLARSGSPRRDSWIPSRPRRSETRPPDRIGIHELVIRRRLTAGRLAGGLVGLAKGLLAGVG